jgi:hypothetical protein
MCSLDLAGIWQGPRSAAYCSIWKRFVQVAGNHVNVLRHVLRLTQRITQRSKHTADQLRGASRAMREAVTLGEPLRDH